MEEKKQRSEEKEPKTESEKDEKQKDSKEKDKVNNGKKKNREHDSHGIGKPVKEKKPLTDDQKIKLVIAIISAVLLVVICITTVAFVIAPWIEEDPNFDYVNSDLKKYITLSSEDYKNYSMNLNIAEPREEDVDTAILSMLTADKDPDPVAQSVMKNPIGPGDVIAVYYRGYIMVDGIQKNVVSNLSNDTPTGFEVGAGKFPTESYPARGIESELIGLIPNQCTKFETISEGTVKEDHVIYVTFERTNTETNKTESGTKERIDLTSERVAPVYGDTFKEMLVGTTIGNTHSFKTVADGVEWEYKDVKIEFVTECERNPIKITGYFPYNTGSETLNNKEVIFEIYIQNMDDYKAPAESLEDISDEYIKSKVMEVESGLRLDELYEYDGETLADKYRSYAYEYLYEKYEEELRSMIAKNMWNYYNEKAVINRIPGGKVEDIYLEYYTEVVNSFEENNGVIFNEMAGEDGEGETETYDNVADYAKVYLGLWYSEEDWTVTIRALAEDLVIERMIMYYVMQDAGLTSEIQSNLTAKIAQIKEEYMEEYIYQYLIDFEESREEFETSTESVDREYAKKIDRIIASWKSADFENEEFAKFYKEREKEMFGYYDEAYFTETAYYELITDYVVSWAQYTTLDGAAIK